MENRAGSDPATGKLRDDFTDTVKEATRDSADALFRAVWGEPVRASARQWRARDSSAHSMAISGPNRGQWYDFSAGFGGDILDFVAVHFCDLSRARDDFGRVIDEAARFCGLSLDKPVDLNGLQARKAARDAKAAMSP